MLKFFNYIFSDKNNNNILKNVSQEDKKKEEEKEEEDYNINYDYDNKSYNNTNDNNNSLYYTYFNDDIFNQFKNIYEDILKNNYNIFDNIDNNNVMNNIYKKYNCSVNKNLLVDVIFTKNNPSFIFNYNMFDNIVNKNNYTVNNRYLNKFEKIEDDKRLGCKMNYITFLKKNDEDYYISYSVFNGKVKK
jgi:hypothetical protein